MAYTNETSSVKTIVPGAEVSGFCDVVARQKISEVSGEVPKLSAGEGIDLSTVDGKTVITNNISAGENISLVYDMETNTYRIDGQGGSNTQIGIRLHEVISDDDTYNPAKNAKLLVSAERYWPERGNKLIVEFDKNGTTSSFEVGFSVPNAATNGNYNKVLSNYHNTPQWVSVSDITSGAATAQINYLSGAIDYVSSNAGFLYTGVDPIQVNNTTNEISITGESLSAGPGINLFESGGYVVISAGNDDYNFFPMTGTDGSTNYTANANFSSFTLTTGQGAAGAHVNMNVKGVHFEAYPATDVSASWYNIITQQDKITCSSVKLTTAASENWFYTSAVPNLNKITFIAPTYGPYETYSALIDDGSTTFVAEVDSGCCRTVVRCWNDDRNKNCWCGLNQETYFYIG